MVESSRSYPKTPGSVNTPDFPEKHIALVGKGSTQEVLNYQGNPMAMSTGGSQADRIRNMYKKDVLGNKPIQPTAEEITPPADPTGPAIDSSQPNIVPV
jgi:hypothetical protein